MFIKKRLRDGEHRKALDLLWLLLHAAARLSETEKAVKIQVSRRVVPHGSNPPLDFGHSLTQFPFPGKGSAVFLLYSLGI
jgi:hypothetical protein